MSEDIKQDIISIITENPKYGWKSVLKKYQIVVPDSHKGKPIQYLFELVYGKAKCEVCSSENLYFLNFKLGFSKTCSKKCATELRGKKLKQRTGFSCLFQNPDFRKETKEKLQKKYGNRPFKSEVIINKRKQTCLEKYGQTNYTKTEEYIEKSKKTNRLKYNSDYHMQTSASKDKIKESNLKKLGVDNPSKSEKVKEKKRKTCLANYGVEYPAQSKIVQSKRMSKSISDSGLIHSSQKQFSEEAKKVLLNRSVLATELLNKTPVELSKQLNVAFSTVYNYAIKYGIRQKFVDFSTESIVSTIFEELNVNFIKNDRKQIKPKELDFFLPDFNIAFEVCGLYWHSESAGKDRLYHKRKLQECEEKNIRLITIFEDELLNYEKIKTKIAHLLKKSVVRIHARKCIIKEVLYKEVEDFLNQTHLQNAIKTKINFAAYYENKIVAVMTFGKNRISLGKSPQQGEFEMIRYSTNANIPGMANKLFKSFVNKYKPQSVISYCDKRWYRGTVYKNLGFEFCGDTEPNYWYSKDRQTRLHRYGFTKHKIVEMGGDPLLSESQNMQNMGYIKIWDCGSSKWVWTNKTHNVID